MCQGSAANFPALSSKDLNTGKLTFDHIQSAVKLFTKEIFGGHIQVLFRRNG